MTKSSQRTVAITGISGNLGWKLVNYLITRAGYTRLIGLDIRLPAAERLASLHHAAQTQNHAPAVIEMVECDLTDWQDRRWRDVMEAADAVVHFAAQNPYPEAGWGDSSASLDINLHIALAAAASTRCKRVVFATSNHVMGRYKDEPLASVIAPGELHTGIEEGVGTVWHTGATAMDSTAYAVAKFAGERVCQAVAQQTNGQTTFVCVRIGWCQPGENLPDTLSASGSPTLQGGGTEQIDPADLARSEAWFKGMWLSNRDFLHLFERAIEADAAQWPSPSIIVNGMSNNRGMKWSIKKTQEWLDYAPQDDVYGTNS